MADIPRDSLPCAVMGTLLPSGYSGGKLRKIGCCSANIRRHQILCRQIRLDPRGVAREWESGTMRKRFVRAAIFIAIALGIAVGAADAAGAVSFGPHSVSTDGSVWD
jgi:hypothetical protein